MKNGGFIVSGWHKCIIWIKQIKGIQNYTLLSRDTMRLIKCFDVGNIIFYVWKSQIKRNKNLRSSELNLYAPALYYHYLPLSVIISPVFFGVWQQKDATSQLEKDLSSRLNGDVYWDLHQCSWLQSAGSVLLLLIQGGVLKQRAGNLQGEAPLKSGPELGLADCREAFSQKECDAV